jgi:hypothetical protein
VPQVRVPRKKTFRLDDLEVSILVVGWHLTLVVSQLLCPHPPQLTGMDLEVTPVSPIQ